MIHSPLTRNKVWKFHSWDEDIECHMHISKYFVVVIMPIRSVVHAYIPHLHIKDLECWRVVLANLWRLPLMLTLITMSCLDLEALRVGHSKPTFLLLLFLLMSLGNWGLWILYNFHITSEEFFGAMYVCVCMYLCECVFCLFMQKIAYFYM